MTKLLAYLILGSGLLAILGWTAVAIEMAVLNVSFVGMVP